MFVPAKKNHKIDPHMSCDGHHIIAIFDRIVKLEMGMILCEHCDLYRRPFMQSPGVDVLSSLSPLSVPSLQLLIPPHAERNSANFNVRACVRGREGANMHP